MQSPPPGLSQTAVEPGNLSRRDARLADQAERRARALRLRREGWTYAAIGRVLGVSLQAASKLVQKELRRIPKEEADQARAMELSRLDKYLSRLSGPLRSADPDVALKALDRAIRISERRARMLGLDVPVKADAPPGESTLAGLSAAEQLAIVDAYAERLRGQRGAE